MTQRDIDPPCFRIDGGLRILVEATDWATREVLGAILRTEGYSVVGCPGPASTDEQCALIGEGGCRAVTDADLIVHVLRHSDEQNRQVLLNLKHRYPDTPIVVEVPPSRVERYRTDFEGCSVVPYPITEVSLLRAIDAALGASGPSARGGGAGDA